MMDLEVRLKRIRLLALDMDGVLTDGQLYYGNYGDEIKSFYIQDGMGIVLLQKAGIPVAIITGKKSKVNRNRAKELKIQKIFENVSNKLNVFQKIAKQEKLSLDEMAFVGDDLNDVPVMQEAGLAVAVANAVAETKSTAHYVTQKSGGHGAVREIIEMILKSQGKWETATRHYLG